LVFFRVIAALAAWRAARRPATQGCVGAVKKRRRAACCSVAAHCAGRGANIGRATTLRSPPGRRPPGVEPGPIKAPRSLSFPARLGSLGSGLGQHHEVAQARSVHVEVGDVLLVVAGRHPAGQLTRHPRAWSR
jgi:hypothetical protein